MAKKAAKTKSKQLILRHDVAGGAGNIGINLDGETVLIPFKDGVIQLDDSENRSRLVEITVGAGWKQETTEYSVDESLPKLVTATFMHPDADLNDPIECEMTIDIDGNPRKINVENNSTETKDADIYLALLDAGWSIGKEEWK